MHKKEQKKINLKGKTIMIIIISICLATFLILSYLSGAFTLFNRIEKENTQNFTKTADQLTEKYMKRFNIPGVSIAVIDNGEMMYSRTVGYADIEEERLLDANTPMRIQSITKTVTAYAIYKLVNEEKLDLDKPVYEYFSSWQFPESKYDYRLINTRNILNHTSGLPLGDVFTIYGPKDPKPSLREKLTQECLLISKPGQRYSYSNTGYNLLELLVEEITGMSFADYVQKEIFEPMGMTKSTFYLNDEQIQRVAAGYGLVGEKTPVYVFPELGSGGMFSTSEDLSLFLIDAMKKWKHEMSPQIVSTQDKLGVYSMVFDGYAAGVFTEEMGELTAVSHGGQGTGIMSHFHAIPESEDAIVIITNSQRSWPYIARMVKLWTDYNGVASSGMKNIIYGQYILSAIIGILFALATALVLKSFSLNGHINLTLKILAGASGISFIVLGFIALFQKYSFVKAIFPFLSAFMFIAIIALGIALSIFTVLSFLKQT